MLDLLVCGVREFRILILFGNVGKHFVFEGGKGRVEVATEQEQNEFGGDWGKRVCRASLDD